MRARRDISENDLLEIAACNPVEVEKHVEAVLRKVLKNGQRPRKIGPPLAEEDGFLDAIHASDDLRANRMERYQKSGRLPALTRLANRPGLICRRLRREMPESNCPIARF